MPNEIIPPHGGYRKLLSYQKSEIIFDGTRYFTSRFYRKFDRTIDQMIQAARSGKQNIVEASLASGTSKETEIKLTQVARASLEELLVDYQDFLRLHGLKEWADNDSYRKRSAELNREPNATYDTFRTAIEHKDPAISANIMIGLIRVTTYLLDQQIKSQTQNFLAHGGIRERMFEARKQSREQGKQSQQSKSEKDQKDQKFF